MMVDHIDEAANEFVWKKGNALISLCRSGESWTVEYLTTSRLLDDHQYLGVDELNGDIVHSWTGSWQHLTLDPQVNPAVVLHIRPWQHVEYVDMVL